MEHAEYLLPVINPKYRKLALDKAVKDLKGIKFDSFAVSGISGTAFGSALAYRMRKGLIVSRKPEDSTHSVFSLEYDEEFRRYIYLDDLVCTGKTLKRVMHHIAEKTKHLECVGVYLFFPQNISHVGFYSASILHEFLNTGVNLFTKRMFL